jgi:hypothetical protein
VRCRYQWHIDAVLFLWAPSPKLADAIRVMDAWGFSYRTCAVWDKEVIGWAITSGSSMNYSSSVRAGRCRCRMPHVGHLPLSVRSEAVPTAKNRRPCTTCWRRCIHTLDLVIASSYLPGPRGQGGRLGAMNQLCGLSDLSRMPDNVSG